MTFEKSSLVEYKATNLLYPQRFADYSFGNQRLDSNGYQIIKSNLDFVLTEKNEIKEIKKQRPRLRL